jgi:hypothetical protein
MKTDIFLVENDDPSTPDELVVQNRFNLPEGVALIGLAIACFIVAGVALAGSSD